MKSLIERGDRVKMLSDWCNGDIGVRQGQTGSVVRVVRKDGIYGVTVQFDGVARDVNVSCGNIEILN